MESLGGRIRYARQRIGWSQAKLAERLGVTTSAVGHWERANGHQPSTENLIEISRHLSIRLEWLAVGEGRVCAQSTVDHRPDAYGLSDQEAALVKRFQELSAPSRALLSQFLETLVAASSLGASKQSSSQDASNHIDLQRWPTERRL